MSKVQSFRGMLTDGGQDQISLHTNNGKVGYKMVKLEIFPKNPGRAENEFVVQVFSVKQSTPPTSAATVDFSDPTLLAVAYFHQKDNTAYDTGMFVVFDNIKFNQDIYVTLTDQQSNDSFCNYHIELETSDLSLDEQTVATLKDIRNNKVPS